MKWYANMKIRQKISMTVSTLLIIGMSTLLIIAGVITANYITSLSTSYMNDILQEKVRMTDEYIESIRQYVKGYVASPDIKAMLENPNDKQLQAKLQQYTDDYFDNREDLEGIYLADKETFLFTHSIHNMVGKKFMDGDKLKTLQEMLLSTHDILDRGVAISPSTNTLVLSIMVPIYSDQDDLLGFVGLAVKLDGLISNLNEHNISGFNDINYALVDLKNMQYISTSNAELNGMEIEDGSFNEMLVKEQESGESILFYIDQDGRKRNAVISNIEGQGWSLIMSVPEAELNKFIQSSLIMLILVAVITIIIVGVFVYIFSAKLGKSIEQVEKSLNKVANLDLIEDKALDKLNNGESEIAHMAQSMQVMLRNFKDIINKLNKCNNQFLNGVQTSNTVANQLVDCANDNAAVTEELSASIDNTNTAIHNANMLVNNIKGNMNSIKSSTEQSTELSRDVLSRNKDMSLKLSSSLKDEMNKIDGTKEKIKSVVGKLSSIEQVKDMAGGILQITSQTKLLALNASIEAARAGVAGKGFAVVAEEIGKLSQESERVVNEIQAMVEHSNHSVYSTKQCFEEIVNIFEKDIFILFNHILSFLTDSHQDIEVISGEMNQIGTRISEVSNFIGIITTEINNIGEASGYNGKAIEAVIEKTGLMVDISKNIQDISEANSNSAEVLQEISNQFKI